MKNYRLFNDPAFLHQEEDTWLIAFKLSELFVKDKEV